MTDANDEPTIETEELNYPETLRLTLADADSMFDEALTSVEDVERGREHQPEAIRAYKSVDDLRRLITDRRLEVLRAIYENPPDSISDLATRLDRAYAVVHEDIQILAEHGIIEFRQGARGAKQPHVPYEIIRVDIPLVGPSVIASSMESAPATDSHEHLDDSIRDSDSSEDRDKWFRDADDPREASHL